MTDPVRTVETLGWMLVHSVWVIAIIGGAAAIAMAGCRNASANVRYLVGCGALCVSLLTLPASFAYLSVHRVDVSLMATRSSPKESENFESLSDRNGNAELEVGADHRVVLSNSFGSESRIGPAETPAAISRSVRENSSVVLQRDSGSHAESRLQPHLWKFVLAWVAGMSILVLRPWFGHRFARKLRATRLSNVSDAIRQLLVETACRMGVTRTVGIVQSGLVRIPCVIGIWKPVILLPASGLTGLPMEQWEAILAHELAHIRRHDYLVNALQTLVETVLFYHPAIWWISRQVRREREHCCDDLVVQCLDNRVDYCRALVAVEESRARSRFPAPSLALGATGGLLLVRVRRIAGTDLGRPAQRFHFPHWTVLSSAVAIATLTLVALLEVKRPSEPQFPEPIVEHSRIVLVEAQSHEVSAQGNAELPVEQPPEKTTKVPAAELVDGATELERLIDQAVSAAERRQLIIGPHSPWQCMDAFRAFGAGYAVFETSERKTTISVWKWLSGGAKYGKDEEAVWLIRNGIAQARRNATLYRFGSQPGFECQPGEFVAWLGTAGVPAGAELIAFDESGHPQTITVRRLVDDLRKLEEECRMEVRKGQSTDWILWALVHYAEANRIWDAQLEEGAMIGRLIDAQCHSQMLEHPYEGSVGLLALALARGKFSSVDATTQRAAAERVERVTQRLDKAILAAQDAQADDGRLNSRMAQLRFRPQERDLGSELGTAGVELAWLTQAIPAEKIADEEWLQRGARRLALDLIDARETPLPSNRLFNAVFGLRQFQRAMKAKGGEDHSNETGMEYGSEGNASPPNSETKDNQTINRAPDDASGKSLQKGADSFKPVERTSKLDQLINKAIARAESRPLVLGVNNPWQCAHALRAVGPGFAAFETAERRSTTSLWKWLSSGPKYGKDQESVWVIRDGIAQARPSATRTSGFESDPGEFVAWLGAAGIPANAGLIAFDEAGQAQTITVRRLVDDLPKVDVPEGRSTDWLLWALVQYSEPDRIWDAQCEEGALIGRLLDAQCGSEWIQTRYRFPVVLMALAVARDKFASVNAETQRAAAKRFERVSKTLDVAILAAKWSQAISGRLQHRAPRSPLLARQLHPYIDVHSNSRNSGSELAWLSQAIPAEKIAAEEWLQGAARRLALDLLDDCEKPLPISFLIDAVFGLKQYQRASKAKPKDDQSHGNGARDGFDRNAWILGPETKDGQAINAGPDGAGKTALKNAVESFEAAQNFEGQERDAKLKDAEKAITKVIKQFKKSALMEDAYFTRGEIYFAQKRYAYAQDDYYALFKNFPATRHTETVTRRLFTIATVWLNDERTEKSDELVRVNAGDVIKPDTPVRAAPRRNPPIPNFLDKNRPLFNTKGRARQALKSVLEHAEPGPLRDDAAELLRTTQAREKLEKDITEIKEQAAERDWIKAEFFRKKGNRKAHAAYCEMILLDHPESSHAAKAREALLRIDPKYRSVIFPDPASSDDRPRLATGAAVI